jgi:small subunit ribosomal protein S21
MFSRFKGIEVRPRPNEEPDRFIKRFLKKVRNDGILQEVFLRRAYEKPSIKRRRKQARARFLKKIEERGPQNF